MSGTNGGSDPVILATAGYDHTVRFWQAHSGICYRTVQHPDSQVNALEITPDKQLIAAAGYQHIRMYDLNTNNPNAVINYDGISKNVTGVGFHADGKWMYTGGEDNSVRIWDLRSRNLQCQRIFQVNAPVNCVCLHPNQGELFIGDQSGSIHVWDLKTDNNEQLIPEQDASILSISIDPMGTMMAAVNNKGNCYIWTLTGGRGNDPTQLHPKAKFEAHNRYVLRCLFSPDSTWVWDCAFSGDSQYIITASSDNMARLWSVDTGEVKKEYSGHQKAVMCLAFRDEFVQ
ncbi:hypothetical protein KUTeg_003701 [Tegillarca granosa]|uniref:Target of rapamycin complex subunit lst8 n=1 Tax=Tegillarca granosa TaxID=220873 RepID=A0ABQ9FQR6_TEGGR|nr:hypothetical protein KUTeg_003701 [Tegillarca granosa]